MFPISARPILFGAARGVGFARVAIGGSLGIARRMSGGGAGSSDDPVEIDTEVSGSGKKMGTKKRRAEKDPAEAAEGKKKTKVAKKATGKGPDEDDLMYAEDEDVEIAPLSSEAAKRAMPRLVKLLQNELSVEAWMVEKAATLFRDGATLPFVARCHAPADFPSSPYDFNLYALAHLDDPWPPFDRRIRQIPKG